MRRTYSFSLCWLLIFLLVTSGLSSAAENESNTALVSPDKSKGLHIAIVPEKNAFEQRKHYSYLTNYLSRKLGMMVYVDIMPNYGEICAAFVEGKADVGLFGSFSYVLTRAKTGIEPIARPVWLDGSSTYRGYIFARKDSKIRSIEDMKGKSLVLVDRATTAGYIFQRYYLQYYSIDDLEDYFSNIYFAGSHDAAAWAVYTKEADVGGAKNRVFNALSKEYPDFKDQMIILAESPEVPSNGFAVRADINNALKVRLRGLLLNLDKSEEGQEILKQFGATKFIKTKDEDYKVIYNMMNKLGIDLTNYPCSHESAR